MSWTNVRDALLLAAQAQLVANGISEDRIGWANVTFDPPTVKDAPFDYPVWANVHDMPNLPEPVSMGVGGEDEGNGILQIDINQPLNTGEQDIISILTALENYFTAGRILSKDSQEVTIIAAGRLPGRTVNDTHYRVSISVSWYAQVQRANPNT